MLFKQEKEVILNPNKTTSVRELGNIDISELKKLVNSLSEQVWEKETASRENDFACFHNTQHIIFRFPNSFTQRAEVHSNPIWWVWQPYLLPILEKAVEPYGYKNGKFKAVMLAKLKAGHSIDQHTDGLREHYYLHKIHIPIQTSESVEFNIKKDTFYLKEGIAYEVNNIVSHSVINKGEQDRIHLIFEYIEEV